MSRYGVGVGVEKKLRLWKRVLRVGIGEGVVVGLGVEVGLGVGVGLTINSGVSEPTPEYCDGRLSKVLVFGLDNSGVSKLTLGFGVEVGFEVDETRRCQSREKSW